MDATTGGDVDGIPAEPTVASILGIKGPLRFRTHGSTQKAHVVLRQVELSDDSGDEGDNNGMVYFSLFAQKRIEVKPGKEILLAVATPDGKFIETPVIFAGNSVNSEDAPSDKGEAHPKVLEIPKVPETPKIVEVPKIPEVPVKEPEPVQGGFTMPPKMRKLWSKRTDVTIAQTPPPPTRCYNSVGVQSEPVYISQIVETMPEPVVQRESSAIQTIPEERNVVTKDVQTDDLPEKQVDDVAAQSPPGLLTSVGADSHALVPTPGGENASNSPARERSLSPMELDSPMSSPALSPTLPASVPPPDVERLSKSMSLSPPGLSVTTSSASLSSIPDVHVSPMHLSPDSGEPPGLSLSPLIASSRINSPPVLDHEEKMPHTKPALPTTLLSSPSQPPAAVTVPSPEGKQVGSDIPSSEAAMSTPADAPSSAPVPYMPKRKVVPNPFVSGGFVTDFVGVTTAPRNVKTANSEEITSRRSSQSLDENAPTTSSPAKDSSSMSPPIVRLSSPPPPPRVQPSVSPKGRSTNSSPTIAASSSKVKVEDIPPIDFQEATSQTPSRFTSTFISPLGPPFLSGPPTHIPPGYSLAPRFGDIPSMPPFPPQANFAPFGPKGLYPPMPPQPPPPNGFSSRLAPPPPSEPKALSYIAGSSVGTYTNPLNIRPSARSIVPRPSYPPNPAPNMVPTTTPPPPKKRVIVGNGWPRVRQPSPAKPAGLNGIFAPQNVKPSPIAPATPLTINTSAIPTHSAPPTTGSQGSPSSTPAPSWPPIPSAAPIPTDMLPSAPSESPHPSIQVVPERKFEAALSALSTNSREPLPEKENDAATPQLANIPPSHPPAALPSQPPPPPPSRLESTPAQQQSPVSAIIPAPPPSSHPLPPKPPAFTGSHAAGGWSPRRGVKRMVSPGPPSTAADARPRRSYKWPTTDGVHTVRIKGDDDVGVRTISFNSDGSHFAVTCFDKSVRIWNARTHLEVAKLAHTMSVLDVAWMDHDAGVVTLGENGIVSSWTRNAQNKWQWAKIIDSKSRQSDDNPTCLAFYIDRIAIGFPRTGVKVWLFIKGTWLPQRSILRQNVSVIKFVEDGDALVGGTMDGVLWHCEIPNGTLRALTFFKSKVSTIDIDSRGVHAVVALAGGRCQLVNIKEDDHKGHVEQIYSAQDPELQGHVAYEFGALFTNRSQLLLHGAYRGCIMVWDRDSGDIVSGLCHGEDDYIQTAACFEGNQVSAGQILTGTRNGQLTWFAQPSTDGSQLRKRVKIN